MDSGGSVLTGIVAVMAEVTRYYKDLGIQRNSGVLTARTACLTDVYIAGLLAEFYCIRSGRRLSGNGN